MVSFCRMMFGMPDDCSAKEEWVQHGIDDIEVHNSSWASELELRVQDS